MGTLLVLLIILGSIGFFYQKSTLVNSVIFVIIAVCSSIAAFGYYEVLADVFINKGSNTKFPAMLSFAQPLSFLLLFIVTFGLLRTISGQLLKDSEIDFGVLPERIGRVFCGLIFGILVSGFFLIFLAMLPISGKFPYQRFEPGVRDASESKGVFFKVDEFSADLFGKASAGGLSGSHSFELIHSGFVDELHLNRCFLADNNDVSVICTSDAIEVPKNGMWYGSEDIVDSSRPDEPFKVKRGDKLVILRLGIKSSAFNTAGKFGFSQVRLVCKKKAEAENAVTGSGITVYPIGYLKSSNQLQRRSLDDVMRLDRADFSDNIKWMDFAFEVPDGYLGVIVKFKENVISYVPKPVSTENAPSTLAFIPASECASRSAKLPPLEDADVYGVELTSESRLIYDTTLKVYDTNQWKSAEQPESLTPAEFDGEKINLVQASLKIDKEFRRPRGRSRRGSSYSTRSVPEGVASLLKPLQGYSLLGLKCNNPAVGSEISGSQLPFLESLDGAVYRPVGVIASGNVDDKKIWEVDYCSVVSDEGIAVGDDGSITRGFPQRVWLSSKATKISEFYVIYLVKSKGTIITSVTTGSKQTKVGFTGYSGFLMK